MGLVGRIVLLWEHKPFLKSQSNEFFSHCGGKDLDSLRFPKKIYLLKVTSMLLSQGNSK